jgi:MoxR-like ATPase
VGASNSLPDDTALAAFAARFLVRCFVDPIPDPMLEQLLESGWSLNQSPGLVTAGLNDIEVLTVAARQADMSGVRQRIAQALRTLRGAGITLTDRRAVRAQKLIAAAALMAGRDKPTEADLWPLIFVLPTREQQSLGRDSLRDAYSPEGVYVDQSLYCTSEPESMMLRPLPSLSVQTDGEPPHSCGQSRPRNHN